MLLPQVKCRRGRKLGENDDGLGLSGAQRSEVGFAVGDGLELDALDEQQFAVLDEQHLVADVAVERGSHLALGVHGIGQFIDQEVERHVDVMRVFTLVAERSEEHTSELQSLMRISYAVFCLKKKNTIDNIQCERQNTTIYNQHPHTM